MKKLLSLFITLCLLPAAALQGQNTVRVSGAEKIEYSPMIFGQFIEHHHRQIYGGLFEPGSPLSDEDGFRTDVIEALREIKVPIVRWPGGCFVSSYHWLDGVGPQRQGTYDKSWQVEDPNTFGTDEYIAWCRKVGCEPYICTNAGTGTAEEMSDWVEYCNLTVGKWGKLRASNGHPEPYGVKYWSVGNENYGSWEIGAKTVDEWGPLVRESSKLMRAVTPDLTLLAAATCSPEWTLPLLSSAGPLLDYISIHGYYGQGEDTYMDCMMRTGDPEANIERSISLLETAGFGGGKIKIAFDEWNLRYWRHPGHGNFRTGFDYEARNQNDISGTYTMADAVFAACFLNSCLRHADIVKMACFSPIVNTRGAICTRKDGLLKRTTYYVFQMYTNRLEKYVVPLSVTSEELRNGDTSTPVISALLTSDGQGRHYVLSVVNKDPEKDRVVSIEGFDLPSKVDAVTLRGRSADDFNDFGDEHVVPESITLKVNRGGVAVPAHSVTFIEFTK